MKRSKPIRIILIVLLLLIIAVGGLFYFYNPKKAIELILPDLSQITYINANVKKDSVRTKIDVIVQNKSPYKLTIDSVYFLIKLNDEQLIEESVPVNLKQLRYQIDTVELPVNISKKKLKRIIGDLKGSDSTDLDMDFQVNYNTVFGRVKLKHHKTKRIVVPVPPRIKILKVERQRYSVTEKTLYTTIQLEIINMGENIDLQLTDIRYELQVENALHSEGTIDKKVSIKPKSTKIIEIPIEIKVERPLKTLLDILTNNDKMNYTLHLQAMMIENMVDNMKQDPIPVEVNASGILELKK